MFRAPRFWRFFISFFLALGISAAAAAPAAAQEKATTPDAIYDVDLSSDGKSYAILREFQGQTIVAIYDADDATKPPLAVGLGDLPTWDFAWGGDSHVLVRVSAERSGLRTTDGLQTIRFSRWMVIDKDTGELHTVFGNETGQDYGYFIGSSGDLISTLPDKPGHALFARTSVSISLTRPSRLEQGADDLTYSLQELNLKRTRAREVESGDEETVDWVVTESGDAIARIDSPHEDRLTVFASPSGKGGFSKIADIKYDESPYSKVQFYGLTTDGDAIQARVTEDSGAQKMMALDLHSGEFSKVLYAPASGYIQDVVYDHRSAAASAVISSNGVHHLDPAEEDIAGKLETAVPGSTMLILSQSVGGARLIAKAFMPDGKAQYYFYDAPGGRLELIAAE
ncbi:hypothetical protein [Hyphococcus sp.]|uniref:hypothetical protein n=1 Tax=Hyphococcus sp. TaxID=2038636 RepID=UPI0035C6F0BB